MMCSVTFYFERQRTSHQLMERDLGTALVEDEPPRVSENSRTSHVDTNDHVTEEEPFSDQRLPTVSRRHTHDRMIRRIKSKSSRRQAVGDQIHPEKLDGYQSLRHSEQDSQEDTDHFSDVGRDCSGSIS